jgi:tRNA threonylcarbamoyl adenosine modification protein YeaZ
MELILDAGARETSVGLALRGTLLWRSLPLDPREHTRLVLPALMEGLVRTSSGFSDLTLLVVALGPGPFNGLRVAVSLVKGLAVGLAVPVVGISTLEAEAYRCAPSPATVRPVVAAGRTGFVTASFQWNHRAWSALDAPQFVEAAGPYPWSIDEQLCGDVLEMVASAGGTISTGGYHTAHAQCARLDALAARGWERSSAGSFTPPAELQPHYVRPPHITIARERRP